MKTIEQIALGTQFSESQVERDFKMAIKKMELDASDIRSQRDSEKFRIA